MPRHRVNKAATAHLGIKLEVELIEQLKAIAKRDFRTVSDQVRLYIHQGLQRDGATTVVQGLPTTTWMEQMDKVLCQKS
ncbi:MAG TPA: hypothetical protein VEC14_06660 [Reyranellaceae bacterium]|nr:hypothetical protein [Reyranellaceae bacterium]